MNSNTDLTKHAESIISAQFSYDTAEQKAELISAYILGYNAGSTPPTTELNYPKRQIFTGWEQRRCDIAATVLSALVTRPDYRYGKESLARTAVEYADILIKTLKDTKQ